MGHPAPRAALAPPRPPLPAAAASGCSPPRPPPLTSSSHPLPKLPLLPSPPPARPPSPFLANSPFSRVCCCSACAWRVPDSRLNKQAARSGRAAAGGGSRRGGGEGEGSVADGPIALEIGGVWVERFGVKCPGILLRTWGKSQGRVWAENVTRGCVEVGGGEAPFFPVFFSYPTVTLLGVFDALGSGRKFATEVQRDGEDSVGLLKYC